MRDGRVGGRKCELERGSRKNSQYKEQVRNYKKLKKYFLKLKQKRERFSLGLIQAFEMIQNPDAVRKIEF